MVAQRFKGHGPMTVQARGQADDASGLVSDTMMTRSIGDWDASRACVPQPECRAFRVERGGWRRVVLASDGLWDVVSREKVAKVAWRAKSANDAAASLAELAWTVSHQRFERLKDDTTVLVVDLDLAPPGVVRTGKGSLACTML